MTDTARHTRLEASPERLLQAASRRGLPHALATHAIWGAMPLYLVLVHAVPPLEFVAWRIVWTLPLCVAAIAKHNQKNKKHTAFSDRHTQQQHNANTTLVAINWVSYVIAIQTGHVFA